MKITSAVRQSSVGVLAAGDVMAFLLWVSLGLARHQVSSNWLFNVVRVVAPFLIGWFVVAPFTGAYRAAILHGWSAFLLRSTLTWLLGVTVGLLLRATLFGSGFIPAFAVVTFVVTGILVLGWRAVFGWMF